MQQSHNATRLGIRIRTRIRQTALLGAKADKSGHQHHPLKRAVTAKAS
jgi:hypothetical protein